MGIWCQTSPGFLRLKGALIGKIAVGVENMEEQLPAYRMCHY